MSPDQEDRNRLRLKAGTTSDSSLFGMDAFAPEGTDVSTGCGREGSMTPVGHLRDGVTRNSCSFM